MYWHIHTECIVARGVRVHDGMYFAASCVGPVFGPRPFHTDPAAVTVSSSNRSINDWVAAGGKKPIPVDSQNRTLVRGQRKPSIA